MEGASYILYDDILKDIRTQPGENFYFIPTSINESIIVPCSTIDTEYTKNMLRNVNRGIVSGQDVLSNNVYSFDGELKIVTLIFSPPKIAFFCKSIIFTACTFYIQSNKKRYTKKRY